MTTTRSSPIWKRSTETNSLYSAAAEAYERHAAASPYNAGYERPAMLDLLGSVRGLRVLDAGCGPGSYASALCEDARSIVAIDASKEMIELVDRKRLPNVVARVHDLAQPLEWMEDASVDLAFSSLALHYLPSWEVPLREFARVLAPGGRLVVSTHHPAMSGALVENYFETQLVTDAWKIEGQELRVSFYHRPMEAVLHPFLHCGALQLARVIEPHLTLAADADEVQRTLASRPWFLLIEAQKLEPRSLR